MNLKTVLAAAGLSVVALANSSYATDYPSKPIEMVIPYAPGGATDVIGRMVADKLSAKFDNAVVAMNRPGAGTTLAANFVSRAAHDGYTIYMTTAAHTISASLYTKLNYDPVADFTPIHLVAKIPIVLVTNPNFEANTLQEFIDSAKANKEGIPVGSPGNGSPQHLTQALFQVRTGANFIHVPYRGDAPLITDMLAGQVQSAFITLSAALPYIQNGQLKALALANPTRIEAIKDVPTMTEAGLNDFNAATWFGMFGPKGLDNNVLHVLHTAATEIATDPNFKERIDSMGGELVSLNPKDFTEYVKAETAQWREAVETSGARVD